MVQYIDTGDRELLSDPACAANLPPGLDFKSIATLVRLEMVVYNINHEVKEQIESWLKKAAENKEILWKSRE